MVCGQRLVRGAAVLAVITVAPENITAVKGYALAVGLDEHAQTDYAGQLESPGNSADKKVLVILDYFRFAPHDQNQRSPRLADMKRLETVIQDQNLRVEHKNLKPWLPIINLYS
jgi:hypothetical protein